MESELKTDLKTITVRLSVVEMQFKGISEVLSKYGENPPEISIEVLQMMVPIVNTIRNDLVFFENFLRLNTLNKLKLVKTHE